MSHFSEMDWNAKWDWENFDAFGSKSIESPKKLQLADRTIVDDGEIHAGSFNLSSGGNNSGTSASDGAKSSISASTDSSTKDGMQPSNFRCNSGNLIKKTERNGMEVSRTSPPPPEASVGSTEPLIGLKLGKRTYFENSGGGGYVKSTSFPVIPTPSSTTTLKKTKSSGQNAPVCCQVEGCNIDLSLAKEYHRKHRVCDSHSKCQKVIVGGFERRFCQQCSRFHSLSEFDEKKRSCRRRLSDHNARRRKPQQDTIQFSSTRLSSPFYGGTQQMSFLLNNSPVIHPRTPANSTWDSAFNSKFTLTKGYPSKSNGDGVTVEQLHMPGMKLPHAINMQTAANAFLESKTPSSEVLNPGSKGSLISSLDAAPEYRRALSLLSSNNSWDSSCEPELEHTPLYQPMHESDSTTTQPMIHTIPEAVPMSSSSELWSNAPQLSHPRVQSLATNNNFQEIQLFKAPYDADFYSNMLN